MKTTARTGNNKNLKARTELASWHDIKSTYCESLDRIEISHERYHQILEWRNLNINLVLKLNTTIKECTMKIEEGNELHYKDYEGLEVYWIYEDGKAIARGKYEKVGDGERDLVETAYVDDGDDNEEKQHTATNETWGMQACIAYFELHKSEFTVKEERLQVSKRIRKMIEEHNNENPEEQIRFERTVYSS